MERAAPFALVAPEHPSLDGAIDRFAAGLRNESRYFGRRGAAAPKPTPSLVRRLTAPGPDQLRLAAVADGEVIGMARLDEEAPDGAELLIAVSLPWRRQGVALALGRDIVARAHQLGHGRVFMRTCYRASELRDLGHELGFDVVDTGRGRLELVRVLAPLRRSA